MLNEFYDYNHKVHCVKDFRGSGPTVYLIAENAYAGQDVVIWSHAYTFDGQMEPETKSVLDQIAKWTGGWNIVGRAT